VSAVLIVEDEKHLADGLRFNLEAEGYSVEAVGDGEAALELLITKREPFDVVVLDVMLPGKDGFAVVSEIRAAGQFVPVLMLTARGHPEDVLRGFEAGADDYLPNPSSSPSCWRACAACSAGASGYIRTESKPPRTPSQ